MVEKRILICEDDEGITDITQLILEDVGYTVATLSDSKNLYATIEEMQPDLLLLDLWVPGISGEDVTRYLKSNEKTRHLPILIMSANTGSDQIADEIGADGFLAKPFGIEDLEAAVGKYLLP